MSRHSRPWVGVVVVGCLFALSVYAADSEDPIKSKHVDAKPVAGFTMKYNFDAEGKPVSGDLKQSADWHETDFAGRAKVRVENGAVYLEKGKDMTGITWCGPLVRKDYEITLEGMRVEGSDFFCGLTFPVGKDPCSLILGGWGGSLVGLSSLDYNDAYNNETARSITFENGKWYRIRLRVYGEKIEAWLDDKKVVDVVITNRKIGIRWEVERSAPLGISTWQTTGAIRSMTMRALTEKPLDYQVEEEL